MRGKDLKIGHWEVDVDWGALAFIPSQEFQEACNDLKQLLPKKT